MARARRDRDVPRELHKRIEQTERNPDHPDSRLGKKQRELGIIQPVSDVPVDAWGWNTLLRIINRLEGTWGWAANVSGFIRDGQGRFGWGATITTQQAQPAQIDDGWGWAANLSAQTQSAQTITADPDDIGL